MSEAEHLIRLRLKDGTAIDFSRTEDNAVHVSRGDHKVVLPKCTGRQTLDLFALLEPLGEIEEEESDNAEKV